MAAKEYSFGTYSYLSVRINSRKEIVLPQMGDKNAFPEFTLRQKHWDKSKGRVALADGSANRIFFDFFCN